MYYIITIYLSYKYCLLYYIVYTAIIKLKINNLQSKQYKQNPIPCLRYTF
jgi:hypothetical protein